MLLFFVVSIIFLSLLGSYLVRTLFFPLEHWRTPQGVLVLLLFLLTPLWPISRSLYQEGYAFWHSSFYTLSYLYLGALSYIIPFLFLVDIFFSRPKYRKAHNPSRRKFFKRSKQLGAVAVAAPFLGKGASLAFARPTLTTNTFVVDELHPDFLDLRIVQLSDLHIGPILQKSWLEELVEQVEELQPDLLVITGDLLDGPVELVGGFLEPFRKLSPRYGKYFVTGNHEFYSGVDAWVAFLRREGFVVLNNQHRLIQCGRAKLLLAGVWDYHGERFGPKYTSSPAKAYAGAEQHDLSILLAHQPRSIVAASEVGFTIQLSGHTHGGQFWPWTMVVHLAQPYVYGAFTVGKSQLFVSSGTGFWGPPLRLGSKQEIVLHTFSVSKGS